MRTAAALLGAATSIPALRELLRAVGFTSDFLALDIRGRDSLGIDGAADVELAAGPGAIRALLIQVAGRELREPLQRLARRLASRAPHVLWLVAAANEDGTEAAVIALGADRGPRVASFTWEPARVVDSDAETLCALASLHDEDDGVLHARYVEVLGRDALTRSFYRALETRVRSLTQSRPARVAEDDARAVALLYVSRLLFLQFLQAKGWLNGERDFLATRFSATLRENRGFHDRVLLPLFFGTLNTPMHRRSRAALAFGRIPFLNGGLFSRAVVERRVHRWRFDDAQMGALFDELFLRYRFVAREDSATWSEASVDPEMLGRAFESLMAEPERRGGGVYYTPHALVARITEQALEVAWPRPTAATLRDLRVLDPACGSGAFLVHALERIATLRIGAGERSTVADVRRDVLTRCIFGVDRNPTAVWLCELRLWLSVVVESAVDDPMQVAPLPNLDRNIRVGDALAGPGFLRDPRILVGSARLERARMRYVRATGARKATLARFLDREERRRTLAQVDREIAAASHRRAELLAALRGRDLFGERHRATADQRRELRRLRELTRALRRERRRIADGGALRFAFQASFAEAQSRGGFDVIVGNPPWVRVHRIPDQLRRQFRDQYEVFRAAHWHDGAAAAKAAVGFASQVDLAALFVERSVSLLRDRGAVALLLPAKLWRSLSGGGVRRLLAEHTQLRVVEDLSESRHAFDAVVYPSIVVATVGQPRRPVSIAVHDRATPRQWELPATRIPFDDSRGSPWVLLPPEARRAFDMLRGAGPALSARFGAPRLGVKSGCNSAFLVRVLDGSGDVATVVDANGEQGKLDVALLRPALRGDAVSAWTRDASDEWIIWTHGATGAPLGRLPTRTRTWLGRRYSDLALRSDARSKHWWALFRTEAASATRPRVVWADIGRRPRALVLDRHDPVVPLNTCYVLHCNDECDAWALAALLNSPIAAAWLNVIAEPARGGYRRYLGWTVGLLPIPRDWDRIRIELADARRGDDDALLQAVLRAFRVRFADIEPLLQCTR